MNLNRREFGLGLLGTAGAIAFRSFKPQIQLRVNGQRIVGHMDALAQFGKNAQGGVSRLAYSDADRQGREYVIGLMRAARLEVSIDAAGNIIGRRAGSDNKIAPLLFGSHIDSV